MSKFRMEPFRDSVFIYKQNDKLLVLSNDDKKLEIPFINDGIIRLSVNHKSL